MQSDSRFRIQWARREPTVRRLADERAEIVLDGVPELNLFTLAPAGALLFGGWLLAATQTTGVLARLLALLLAPLLLSLIARNWRTRLVFDPVRRELARDIALFGLPVSRLRRRLPMAPALLIRWAGEFVRLEVATADGAPIAIQGQPLLFVFGCANARLFVLQIEREGLAAAHREPGRDRFAWGRGGALVAVLGALCFGVIVFAAAQTRVPERLYLRANGVQAIATITSLDFYAGRGSPSRPTCQITYRFEPGDGRAYAGASIVSSSAYCSAGLGGGVAIAYDAARPARNAPLADLRLRNELACLSVIVLGLLAWIAAAIYRVFRRPAP